LLIENKINRWIEFILFKYKELDINIFE
jgi:hypothetical protein